MVGRNRKGFVGLVQTERQMEVPSWQLAASLKTAFNRNGATWKFLECDRELRKLTDEQQHVQKLHYYVLQ